MDTVERARKRNKHRRMAKEYYLEYKRSKKLGNSKNADLYLKKAHDEYGEYTVNGGRLFFFEVIKGKK